MLRAGLWHRGRTIGVGVETPEKGRNWFVQVPSVPEGVFWRLKTVAFQLLSSAVVATRTPRLVIAPSNENQSISVPYLVINHLQTQAAAITGFYHFFEGNTKTAAQSATSDLPNDLRLPAGMWVGTFTGAMDVDDQYANIRLLVEEWIYEPPGERTPNIGDGADRVDTVKLTKAMERLAQLMEAQQATP